MTNHEDIQTQHAITDQDPTPPRTPGRRRAAIALAGLLGIGVGVAGCSNGEGDSAPAPSDTVATDTMPNVSQEVAPVVSQDEVSPAAILNNDQEISRDSYFSPERDAEISSTVESLAQALAATPGVTERRPTNATRYLIYTLPSEYEGQLCETQITIYYATGGTDADGDDKIVGFEARIIVTGRENSGVAGGLDNEGAPGWSLILNDKGGVSREASRTSTQPVAEMSDTDELVIATINGLTEELQQVS